MWVNDDLHAFLSPLVYRPRKLSNFEEWIWNAFCHHSLNLKIYEMKICIPELIEF